MAGIDDWIDPRAKDFFGLLPPTQSPTIAPPVPPPGQPDYTYTPPVPTQQFLSGIGATPPQPPPVWEDTSTGGPSMPAPQWTATTPVPPQPQTAVGPPPAIQPPAPTPPVTPAPEEPYDSSMRPGETGDQYINRIRIKNQSDIGSAWDVGVLGMQQLGAGLVAAGGDAVGSEGVRQWGAQKYQDLEKEMQPYQEGRITQFEQIKDLGDVGRFAAWSVGQMAPSVVESIGSALVGAAIGTVAAGPVAGAATGLAGALGTSAAKTFVAKRVAEAMAKGAVKEVAEAAANKALAQTVGAGAAMFASSYGMGVGDIYGETMDKDGKGSVGLAALGALPYAALDAFTDLSVFGSILRGTGGDKALARFGKAMLTAGVKEGGAEAGQEAILMLAGAQAGKEYDQATVMSRLGNSFAAAFIGGGVMGIPAGRKGPSTQEREAGTLSALATVGLASAPDSAALHPVLATATAAPEVRLAAAAKVDAALRASGLEDLADLWTPMAQKAIQAGQPIRPTSVVEVAARGAKQAAVAKQAAMANGIPEPEAETLSRATVEQTAKVVTEVAAATAHAQLTPEQKLAKIAEIEAGRLRAQQLREGKTGETPKGQTDTGTSGAGAPTGGSPQGPTPTIPGGGPGAGIQPILGANPPEVPVSGPATLGTNVPPVATGASGIPATPGAEPVVLAPVGVQPGKVPQGTPVATGTPVDVQKPGSVPTVSEINGVDVDTGTTVAAGAEPLAKKPWDVADEENRPYVDSLKGMSKKELNKEDRRIGDALNAWANKTPSILQDGTLNPVIVQDTHPDKQESWRLSAQFEAIQKEKDRRSGAVDKTETKTDAQAETTKQETPAAGVAANPPGVTQGPAPAETPAAASGAAGGEVVPEPDADRIVLSGKGENWHVVDSYVSKDPAEAIAQGVKSRQFYLDEIKRRAGRSAAKDNPSGTRWGLKAATSRRQDELRELRAQKKSTEEWLKGRLPKFDRHTGDPIQYKDNLSKFFETGDISDALPESKPIRGTRPAGKAVQTPGAQPPVTPETTNAIENPPAGTPDADVRPPEGPPVGEREGRGVPTAEGGQGVRGVGQAEEVGALTWAEFTAANNATGIRPSDPRYASLKAEFDALAAKPAAAPTPKPATRAEVRAAAKPATAEPNTAALASLFDSLKSQAEKQGYWRDLDDVAATLRSAIPADTLSAGRESLLIELDHGGKISGAAADKLMQGSGKEIVGLVVDLNKAAEGGDASQTTARGIINEWGKPEIAAGAAVTPTAPPWTEAASKFAADIKDELDIAVKTSDADAGIAIAQGIVDRWMTALGITQKVGVVMDNSKPGASMTPVGNTWRMTLPSDYAQALASDQVKARAVAVETVLHEVGHVIDEAMFQKLPQSDQDKLHAAYLKWEEEAKKLSPAEARASRYTPMRAARDLLMEQPDSYILNESEWRSDNIARAILGRDVVMTTNKQARTIFGDLATAVRTAYKKLMKLMGYTGPDKVVDDLIEYRLKRIERDAKQRAMKSRFAVDETKDDILAAVAKLGGLSVSEAKQHYFDKDDLSRRGFSIHRVFTAGGNSFDGMSSDLDQYGYPVRDEQGKPTENMLVEAIKSALGGKRVISVHGAESEVFRLAQKREDSMADMVDWGVLDDQAEEDNVTQYEKDAADLRNLGVSIMGEEAYDAMLGRLSAKKKGIPNDEYLLLVEEEILDARNRQKGQGAAGQGAPEGFTLAGETEEEIRAAAAEAKRLITEEEQAAKKAKADRELPEFRLQDRDVNPDQEDMFSQPPPKPKPPAATQSDTALEDLYKKSQAEIAARAKFAKDNDGKPFSAPVKDRDNAMVSVTPGTKTSPWQVTYWPDGMGEEPSGDMQAGSYAEAVDLANQYRADFERVTFEAAGAAQSEPATKESLLAGDVSISEYLSSNGVDPDDYQEPAGLGKEARKQTTYGKVINDIRETLHGLKESQAVRMALNLLNDTIEPAWEHPFRNSYATKLPPVASRRFMKRADEMPKGEEASREHYAVLDRLRAEAAIRAVEEKTVETPEVKPEPVKEYRYALVNRPSGLGATPREGMVRAEPRPNKGEDHYDIARHGFIVYSRELTDKEVDSFELARVADGEERAKLARTVADGMKEYADEIIAESKDDPRYVRQVVADRLRAIYGRNDAVSVGDIDKFSEDVLGILVGESAPLAETVAKQPWEMTQQEFVEQVPTDEYKPYRKEWKRIAQNAKLQELSLALADARIEEQASPAGKATAKSKTADVEKAISKELTSMGLADEYQPMVALLADRRFKHERSVREALADKKSVPAAALAEYADLTVPGQAETAWAPPTDPEKRAEQRQMYEDNIATKRERGEKVPEQWLTRLDQIKASDAGVVAKSDEIVARQVFGHPMETDAPGFTNLVPIKFNKGYDFTQRIAHAEGLLKALQVKFGRAEAIKNGGIKVSPIEKRKQVAWLGSGNASEDRSNMERLRDETIPELYRLADLSVPAQEAGQSDEPNTYIPAPTLKDLEFVNLGTKGRDGRISDDVRGRIAVRFDPGDGNITVGEIVDTKESEGRNTPDKWRTSDGETFKTLPEAKKHEHGLALEYLRENGYVAAVGEAKFSRQPIISPQARVPVNETPTGMTAAQVQAVADDFGSRLLGASKDLVRVRVVSSQAEAFGPASRDQHGRVRGGFHNGTIILVAENLSTSAEIRALLRHESMHYAIAAMSPQDRAEFFRRVIEAAGGNRYIGRIKAEVEGLERTRYLVELADAKGDAAKALVTANYKQRLADGLIAEEVFARVAESERSMVGQAWDRLLTWLRAKLRALGLIQGPVGLTEMRALAASIAGGIRTGRAGEITAATPDIRFSFAGEGAKTADRFALDTAKARLTAGEDADAVRQSTGWFQGDDGKWRFEIDDSGAMLRTKMDGAFVIDGDTLTASSPLGSVLAHPALFAAYPQLRMMSTRITIDPKRKENGEYNVKSRGIEVTAPNDERALSVLLHEVMHGIQTIENFAQGGDTSPRLSQESRNRLINEMMEWMLPTDKANGIPWRDTWDRAASYVDSDQGRYGAYQRLSGEVESRNVQARQGMTRADRRARGPEQTRDVPREDVIVVWDGKEMASAPRPANAAPTLSTDLADQSRYLADEAKARGFADPDEFLAKDTDGFMALAADWRDGHPRMGADGGMRFSREAGEDPVRAFYGRAEAAGVEASEFELGPMSDGELSEWRKDPEDTSVEQIVPVEDRAVLIRVAVDAGSKTAEISFADADDVLADMLNGTDAAYTNMVQWQNPRSALKTILQEGVSLAEPFVAAGYQRVVDGSTEKRAVVYRHGLRKMGFGVTESDGGLRFSRGPATPTSTQDYANGFYDWFQRRKLPNAAKLTVLNRTVGTPFNLAQRIPQFKRAFEAMSEQRDTRNNTALGAESLAPNTFADQEHGLKRGWYSAINVARRSRKREEALVQAALNEQVETEDGGSINRTFTDAELTGRGFTKPMIDTYRERLKAAHYALDRSAQSLQVKNLWSLLKEIDPSPTKGWKLTIETGRIARQILGNSTEEAAQNAEELLRPTIDLVEQRIKSHIAYLQQVQKEVQETKKTLDAARAKPEGAERVTEVKRAEAAWTKAKDLESKVAKELAEATKLRERIGRFGERDMSGNLMRSGTGTLGAIEGIDEKVKTLQERAYFPLMRFGKYTVSVYNPDGTTAFFGRYQSEDDAKAAEVELAPRLTEGQVSKRGTYAETAYEMYNQISMDTLSLFVDYIDAHDPEAKQQVDLLREYIRIGTADNNALKRQLHREGTPGWSKDSRRVLASYILSESSLTATNLHAAEVSAAIQAIPKEMGDVQDYANKLQGYNQDPGEEFSGLRNLMFFWYLGGSIASATVNLTQIPMVTAPYLTQFGSVAQVTKAIKDAYAMVVKGIKDDGTVLGDAYKKAEQEGYIAPQQIYSMMGTARGGTLGAGRILRHPGTQWLLNFWSTPFAWAEQVNRSVTFIAAYNLAAQSGKNAQQSFDAAVQAINETQFIYDKTNRPVWARGFGAPLFTFKTFTIQYLELLMRLPAKQQAMMLGMMFMVAGLGGLPGEEDAEDLIDTIMQVVFGKAWQTRTELNNLAENLLGETLGSVVVEGAPSALGLIDFRRLGMGNILPGTGALLPGADTGGQLRAAGEVLGPTTGLIQDAAQAITKIGRGEFGSAGYNLVPKAMRNWYDGFRSLQTGTYEDAKGRTVMPVGSADAWFKVAGFQPRKVAEYQQAKWQMQKRAGLQRTMEDAFLDRMARAKVAGDVAGYQDAKQAVEDWNRRNQNDKIQYSRTQVITRVKAIKAMSRERFLKSMPPELREEAAKATR